MSENPRGIKADAFRMFKKFTKEHLQQPLIDKVTQLPNPLPHFFPAPNVPSYPHHAVPSVSSSSDVSQQLQPTYPHTADHHSHFPNQPPQNPVNSAPYHVGNAATYGPTPPTTAPVQTSVLPHLLVDQIYTRPYSARVKFGQDAVREACKGLSRVIAPGNDHDVQLFGSQLRNTDSAALTQQHETCLEDHIPCFAVSYVQEDNSQVVGRFKFSAHTWENLHFALREVQKAGVQKCRLWLDQCLWIRDASMGSWAHSGLMPYILWPVISLSARVPGTDRSEPTYRRMWPFVEELAGLWSLGVLMTSEYRNAACKQGDVRRWMSFNHRVKLEPEHSFELLLKNIYHGAADSLQTGWVEDVEELKDMARWNMGCTAEHPIVGPGWRERIIKQGTHSWPALITGLQLSKRRETSYSRPEGDDVWLDASRICARGSWDGLHEWTSGNGHTVLRSPRDFRSFNYNISTYNCLSDRGEFQIIHLCNRNERLNLLVAMDGRSSGITRGKVAWTKVLSGSNSCHFPARERGDPVDCRLLSQILAEQLRVDKVHVFKCEPFTGPVEWV